MLLNIFSTLYNELIGFFEIDSLVALIKSGDYNSLKTFEGIKSVLLPVIPLLLIFELLRAAFYKRFRVIDYKVQFFTHVFNRFIAQFLSIAVTTYCIGLFEKYAIIKTTFTWYWFIYAYIVWELAHFVYHFLA
ncbi:MAG TPA: hypothetical protein VKT28_07780, partial [Puia sp.]|nr:hypothetical protein [Puia sp.]